MTATQHEVNDLTKRFLDHAFTTTFDDFSPAELNRAKHRIVDALGTAFVGHRSTGTKELVELVASWGGRQDATIIGDGRQVPAHHAAMINALLMRSFDFEPVGAEGPGRRQVAAHLTGTTVPVALALGERVQASGREILTALLVGEDIAARLAFGSGFDVYSGQDNTGTVNGIGATITAALLLKLSVEQTRHALGIVTNQLAGTVESIFDQASAFKLPMAFAARNAIMAAEMAAAGVTGPHDPLQGKFGFIQTYCASPDPDVMVENLGTEFYSDSVIKPWSCCRAAQPSLDATVQLRNQHQLGDALDRIKKVVVHVAPRTASGFVGQPFTIGECPEVSAAFSIHYTTAAALVHGTVLPQYVSEDALNDPRIQDMLTRIDIRGTLDNKEVLTAEVDIHLDDDATLSQRVDVPLGDVHHRPLTEELIYEKFFENVRYSGRLENDDADAIIRQVSQLPQLEDTRELVSLFGTQH